MKRFMGKYSPEINNNMQGAEAMHQIFDEVDG